MAWTIRDIPDQAGRVAVITGATSGIGLDAAIALAGAGMELVLTGRDAGRGQAALTSLRRRHPQASARFELVDNASLASLAAFAERWGARPLDLLLNNAGVMGFPRRTLTADGFEMQFGTNHLGHFALTHRLMPALLAAASPRVVTIASIAHRRGRIEFDNLQGERRYVPFAAYAQSKLANLMFALELQRRSGGKLASMAAHPGLAVTNIMSSMDKPAAALVFRAVAPLVAQPAAAGALPGLYAATAPEARGGGYYGPDGLMEFRGKPVPARIMPHAQDVAVAARLWDISGTLTGVG